MGKLTYSAITSLDGFIEDEQGSFGWAQPDEEVSEFVNDRERLVGTYLYGRRMYETMVFWETAESVSDAPPSFRDWTAIWQAADKIVFSRSLEAVSSRRTRLEREFEPEVIQKLKDEGDLSVGGFDLAAQLFKAGLVDECELYLTPVVVGGGKPSLPTGLHLDLELLDERRFRSGVVFLHYRIKRSEAAPS